MHVQNAVKLMNVVLRGLASRVSILRHSPGCSDYDFAADDDGVMKMMLVLGDDYSHLSPLMGVLLHLVQRGGTWTGCGPAQSPPRFTKCNSPPINGLQCTKLPTSYYSMSHYNCLGTIKAWTPI